MIESTWYVGPLADMRALGVPEVGVRQDQVRFGGVHRALSGAATADLTGTKIEYDFTFKWMDEPEWAWLDALNTQLVPGPYYLLDPMKKNRLPIEATKLKIGATDPESVVYWAHRYAMSDDRPTAVTVPMRSIILTSTRTNAPYRINPVNIVPVLTGETITASVYMKADASFAVSLGMDYFRTTYDRASPTGTSVNVTVGTTWQRHTITRTIPTGVNGVRFYANPQGTGRRLSVCAPQIEEAATATAWSQGGGGIQVIIDELRTQSHRFPLRESTMKLLEA